MKIFRLFLGPVAALFAMRRASVHVDTPEKIEPGFVIEPARKNRAAKKSSAGHYKRKITTNRYVAWKKLFGGLAVPQYH